MPHQNQKRWIPETRKHFEKSLSGFFSICANNFWENFYCYSIPKSNANKIACFKTFSEIFLCRTKNCAYIFFMSKNICFKCIKIFFGIPIFPSFFRKKFPPQKDFYIRRAWKLYSNSFTFFSRKFFGNFRIFPSADSSILKIFFIIYFIISPLFYR